MKHLISMPDIRGKSEEDVYAILFPKNPDRDREPLFDMFVFDLMNGSRDHPLDIEQLAEIIKKDDVVGVCPLDFPEEVKIQWNKYFQARQKKAYELAKGIIEKEESDGRKVYFEHSCMTWDSNAIDEGHTTAKIIEIGRSRYI